LPAPPSEIMAPESSESPETIPDVKCVVWDLDHTLWRGVYLENDDLVVDEDVRRVIVALDERGILQSIASRNPAEVLERVAETGLGEYFLYPQAGWGEKSEALARIAERLRISLDTFLFIDDDRMELDAVLHAHPQVRCCLPSEVPRLLEREDLRAAIVTGDARLRRQLYRSEERRAQDESTFTGSKVEFLRTLGMKLAIRRAAGPDLDRAAELTARTHQLNTTGVAYTRDELEALFDSPDHRLLVCTLDDVYGTYGTVGLVMLQCAQDTWTIQLLTFSCRVLSRNVAATVVRAVLQRAAVSGLRALHARLVSTERNRPVVVTFRLMGFRKLVHGEEASLYTHELTSVDPLPDYIHVEEEW